MFHGNNERYPNPTYHFSQSFIVLVMLCTQNSAKFSIDSTRFTFFSSIYISAILVTHTRIKEPPLAHFIPFHSHIALRIFPILFFFSSPPFTSHRRDQFLGSMGSLGSTTLLLLLSNNYVKQSTLFVNARVD